MDYMKEATVVRKVKKKHVKDELDRIKQAEKKKRRLEKALAASAAIRSELEKKKQKKKEEQQRLDEEGAAIAEAVALQVLLGEDMDDSCEFMLEKKNEVFNHWDCANNFELIIGGRNEALPLEGFGWAYNASGDVHEWNNLDNNGWSFSSVPSNKNLHGPYYEGSWGATGISAGLITAQAMSSLHIAEDAHVDSIFFNTSSVI